MGKNINGDRPTAFPLEQEKLPFTIPVVEEPRPKIAKLVAMITDRVPAKLKGVKGNDPEYWGLADLISDEMADVALKMGVRKPKTIGQLMKLTKLEREPLQKLLDDMAWVGLIEYNWENLDGKNPNHEKRYVLPQFVPGSAEFFNMRRSQMDEHPQVAAFFERMTFLPLEKITPMVPPGGAGIGMHVIPVEKAIETENQSISVEHISHWLDKYEGKYAASPCSCRKSRLTFDEGCADDPEGWCVAVGDMADYVVETGKGGRYITKEEALEIFRKGEENGFVHQITNIDGADKIFAICNCNINVCYALRTSQLFNTPNLSRSAYVARVEKDDCVACGKCVEVCPAGAVKLGQKLCTKDGKQVEYPKHPLPSEMKWGPHMWDENYRDNNRINCYETGTSPCKVACPAHIAVQGYIRKAKEGKYREALELIKKDNPFPAICGRVCNKRCEAACTRGTIDEAVAIDDIKKFIAEQDLHAETRFVPEVVIPSNVDKQWSEKIAIIGAGPAGLSCAYYLATKGYKPTVFEKNARPGGMLTYGIPSYKLEKDVIEAEIDVLRELGVEIKCGVNVGTGVTIDELRKQGYKAFYVAIGCQGGRLPGIPGEDAIGTDMAVSFLHDATENHDRKLVGKTVVIGGGNVAVDCARTAVRFGSEEVGMYCLESRETMPASVNEIKETLEDGISINNGWGPKEILKDEKGNVKAVVFKKCLSVIDPKTNRFNPQYDENDTITVEAQHVIFAIGQSVVWNDLLKGTKVEFHHGNYPVADSLTYQTAEPDIFVGGDVYSGPKFAIDAIEAGKNAAVSLHRFVQPGTSMTIGRNRRQFVELDKDNIVIDSYDTAGRQEAKELDGDKHSFRDLHGTLTEEQVRIEASRCLGCGASIVDENKCIGCGICTTKCEFDAIHLHREHPECSKMSRSEDKFKEILPYAIKRGMKIAFGKKTPEEKASQKRHKAAKKAAKQAKKDK